MSGRAFGARERKPRVRHITRQMGAWVINGFQASFDTHMVERRILRLYTEAIARELLEYSRTSADPLHQFSAHFAKWIDSEFGGQIRQTRKVSSNNLAGEPTQNQEWERIDGATPIT